MPVASLGLELADPEEDLGVRMIRQAAERTGDAVGDGTSTSALLAHALYAEACATSRRARARSTSSAGSTAA